MYAKARQDYKPLCRQPACDRGGGSVQQGLSAAFGFSRLCWHRGVADKRYSLDIMDMRRQQAKELMPHLIRALAFMQMIEDGLRLYVGTAEELISAGVPYGVSFRVDRKGINKAALGKITTMFEKVNRNEELIAHLRKLPEHRNYLAHAAFMQTILGIQDEDIDLEYAKKHAVSVGDHAEELLKLIG